MAHLPSDYESPRNFQDCVSFLAASVDKNATVKLLLKSMPDDVLDDRGGSEDFQLMRRNIAAADNSKRDIESISKALEELNMRKFIPLSRSNNQSGITMAFYAGDGIVVKVTHNSFMPAHLRPMQGSYTPLPGVLPPIHSRTHGQYTLEVFPWINTKTVDDHDLGIMKRYLARYNLKFKNQDDRIDNIGLLPNGLPAVLDTDAVEPIDPSKPVGLSHSWANQIYTNFGKLYTELAERLPKLVSDEPDFSLKFQRAHTPPRHRQSGRDR